MLVFDIELLDIIPGPKPIAPPMDLKAAPATALKDGQGNAYVILAKGKGKTKVSSNATITLHFTAWKPSGEMLQSTHQMGGKDNADPPKVPLDRLPEPWQKVVTDMVEGEKRLVWMTNDTAMGPAGETRIFEFDVLGATEPPPAPADVKAPPADAQKTSSGLASKVLTKGKGKVHPKATDQVEVHYTGWTTDGKMFDSSVVRGQPARFRLNGVIPGWTEGVQLMVVGEKRRFWIPEELAYKGGGGPQGMLVFDIELLQINPGPEGAPTKPGARPASK
jgi:peptidylprolyl isomerase